MKAFLLYQLCALLLLFSISIDIRVSQACAMSPLAWQWIGGSQPLNGVAYWVNTTADQTDVR